MDTLTTEACKYQLLLAPPSAQTALHSEKNMSDDIRGLKLDIFIIKHLLISTREKWLESELLLKQRVNAVFIIVCLYHRVMMMIVIVMVVTPPALGAALVVAVLYCREC